ncbi:unnamed protein product [Hermetia illucens]|uniref:Uncharacterized protein n=1 Tax=Hermetia illucens TaxID=343691 RepID=A0A7R8UD50_HERIL|nr:unnamed protein product [Hermetia illucens]
MSVLVNPSAVVILVLSTCFVQCHQVEVDCGSLLMGQFICPDPSLNQIDPKTQQLRGCTKENKAKVWCVAVEGINCTETKNAFVLQGNAMQLDQWLSFRHRVAVVRQLIDIILIATQVVGPADGSAYIIPYYGAGITVIRSNNWTYRLPQDDW